MSVYNLFPQPFVRSALPLHSRSLLRETVPGMPLPRGWIGLAMRLSRPTPFFHQGA